MSEAVLNSKELKRGFLGLYFGRIVMSVSTGLLGVFLPIFLYKLFGDNIHAVTTYYAAISFFYLLFVISGARLLNKFGFKRALIVATIVGAIVNICYYFLTAENGYIMMPFLVFLVLIFRLMFWVPYHVDFTIFTRSGKRGGQIGLLLGTLTLLGVAGPIAGGYLIEHIGISVIFLISIALFLFAIIPFITLPNTHETFSWGYAQTWKELLAKKNRSIVLGSAAAGAEEIIGIVIWPVFIFILLEGDYFKVGALSSLVAGITVLVQLYLGRYLDRVATSKKHVLKWWSLLYSLGWIVKIFVVTAFQVFVVGLYHKVTKIFTETSFNAIFYDLTDNQGHYVDEYTVLSEMAMQVGKVLALGAVSVMALYVSIQWSFVIAAFAALLLNTLYMTVGTTKLK